MRKWFVALAGLYMLFYLLPLGARPLFTPDETRYFEIPREMIASGDWVVPRLNGIRYFEKPVFGYWLNAVSMLVFGQNAFAVRLPSAVSVGISAFILFMMVRRFAGGTETGVLTASIFMTSLLVLGVGTFSVLDSVVSMFLTVGLIAVFSAYQTAEKRRRFGLLFLSGGFFGLGFLTKGFLAFAVPVLTLVPYTIWERRFKLFLKTSWVPVISALLVVLPWGLAIHFKEGDFWRYFFWVEHIHRFLSPEGGQHPEPMWFFIPVFIAGALPWSAMIPAAIKGLRSVGTYDSLIRFAVCWLAFPFIFFSASSGKLTTYILPCYPPFAILMAMGLENYFRRRHHRTYAVGAAGVAGLAALAAVVLAVNQGTGFIGITPYDRTETLKWVMAFAGLSAWSLLTVSSIRQKDFKTKLTVFTLAPAFLFIAAHFIMPNLTLERKAPGQFLIEKAKNVHPDATIVADGDLIRSVGAFLKRDDAYVYWDRSELVYGLTYEDARNRLLGPEEFRRLIDLNTNNTPEKQPVVFIARADILKHPGHLFPEPSYKDQYGNFVFMRF